MSDREVVRDFYGRILGTITTDSTGNKTVRDFYGRILGKYDKKQNVTRDFYGRIVAKGDRSSALIPPTTKKQ
mgnify:CR=1 FL=1